MEGHPTDPAKDLKDLSGDRTRVPFLQLKGSSLGLQLLLRDQEDIPENHKDFSDVARGSMCRKDCPPSS